MKNKIVMRRMVNAYVAAKKHRLAAVGSSIQELELCWYHDKRRELIQTAITASDYDDGRAARFGLRLHKRLERLEKRLNK
jgi:hypothetical protein